MKIRRDQGTSLVEVLVATVIVVGAGVAILISVAISARTAAAHRRAAAAQATLASAAALLESPGTAFVACTSGESVVRAAYHEQLAAVPLPASTWPMAEIEVSEPVTFWNGTSFGEGCFESSGYRLQQIVVRVFDSEYSTEMTVVKRPSPHVSPYPGLPPLVGSPTAPKNPLSTNQFPFTILRHTVMNFKADGGVAIGGSATLAGGSTFEVAVQGASTFTAPGEGSPTGLMVGGAFIIPPSADAASELLVKNGFFHTGGVASGHVVASDTQTAVVLPPASSPSERPRLTSTASNQSMEPGSDVVKPGLIDFERLFAELNDYSRAMGELLDGTCPSASAAQLLDSSGLSPWTGAGEAKILISPNQVHVLTLNQLTLDALTSVQAASGSAPLSATSPLIINVVNGGTVTIPAHNWSLINSMTPFVLWNFPHATSVRLPSFGTVYGTVFAPNATASAAGPDYEVRGDFVAIDLAAPGGYFSAADVQGIGSLYRFNGDVPCL